MRKTTVICGALALSLSGLVAACGSEEWDSLVGEQSTEPAPGNEEVSQGELIDVEIELTKSDNFQFNLASAPFAPGFSLAAATRVVANLTGCSSGYSITGFDTAVSGTSMKVYTGDRGCVGQLVSFTLSGETYTPVSGLPFSGSSGSAFFRNAGNTITLEVFQFSNLSSPIVPTDKISFGMRDIQLGSAYQVMATQTLQGFDGNLNPATDWRRYKPNFRFFGFPEVTGLTNQGGNREQTPIFSITLECATTLVSVGPDLACPSGGYNQILTSLWYRWREASQTALTYTTYASVHDDIRTSKGNPKGEILPGTTQVVVGQVLPASTGFNGGIRITNLVYVAPGGNSFNFRHFAMILTTSNVTSQTAYGHSALAFSLTK